jgi:hypothetical protein
MTPLEWIGLAQLVIIPIITWAWKTWGDQVKNDRVKGGIDTFVRAAEELAASDSLPKDTTKEDFVLGLVFQTYGKELRKFGLDKNAVKLLIAAACQAAGVGASGKQNSPS